MRELIDGIITTIVSREHLNDEYELSEMAYQEAAEYAAKLGVRLAGPYAVLDEGSVKGDDGIEVDLDAMNLVAVRFMTIGKRNV